VDVRARHPLNLSRREALVPPARDDEVCMPGIAGLLELTGAPYLPGPLLRAMTGAPATRGPDGPPEYCAAGVGLGLRHPVAASPARPGTNEDGTVVVCCGWPLAAAGLAPELQSRGHRLRGDGDGELLAHLWEDRGPDMLQSLRGGFAFALWDARQRRLFLARDRLGIASLYWARRGDWLLFASDIRALLASGLVRPAPDRLGLDHLFTFLGLPSARTCFEGVQALLPGHYLLARPGRSEAGTVERRRYWDVDYPDRGQEEDGAPAALADRLEQALLAGIGRCSHGDRPPASYVSGGIDCGTLLALAGKARGSPLASLTIRLQAPGHDETDRALRVARAAGSEPVVVTCAGPQELQAYPRLIQAAECPVPDPSCAALLLLAERAVAEGHRAALSGDGADDLFAGYPWFRTDRLLRLLDWLPGVRPSQAVRRLYLRLTAPPAARRNLTRMQALVGGHHAWLDAYGLIALSKFRFYGPGLRDALGGRVPYEDLELDLERMRRWHPLHQGLYMGMKVHLPGLQLQAKGARAAAAVGLELRYPFLDEEVVAFACRLHPRWKLRRLRDKYLLRRIAERWLPRDIAWRPKSDFLAPFAPLFAADAPAWVGELLSEASLRRTGYFDPEAVRHWREHYGTLRRRSGARLSTEVGLAGVVATQLWHHTFVDGSLASLPSLASSVPGGPGEVTAPPEEGAPVLPLAGGTAQMR
jgi:asparagine synthase (glutamine-hydrolysing)